MQHGLTNQARFDLTIEKLVYGGDGLGRLDGRVVLAPFVLPGEKIRVETEQERPGLLRTRLIDVLSRAPDRVDPGCPFFARCGGCHYQHAAYSLQLAVKRSILAEEMRRIGKISPPEEIAIVASEPWKYRNRSQFHISGGAIGYLESRSHKLCPIDHCPISSPKINSALAVLREMIHDSRWPGFVRSVELFTNEREVQLNILEAGRPVARRFFEWCYERIPGSVPGALEYSAAGAPFRIHPRSFFQVNRFLIDNLVAVALETFEGESAVDLYAGVGLFSLSLASRFKKVKAVESGGSALRDLRFNADRAGLEIDAEQTSAERFLETLQTPPDYLLADPPRAGLGKHVVRRIAELQPPRITIVACDPATLARDLAGLVAAGYRMESMTMIDLFPQTFHIETVVQLRR